MLGRLVFLIIGLALGLLIAAVVVHFLGDLAGVLLAIGAVFALGVLAAYATLASMRKTPPGAK